MPRKRAPGPLLRRLEVDEAALDVCVHEAHADAVADVVAIIAGFQLAFHRRMPDAHPRALLRRAGNDAVEQCPDAALEKELSCGFTDRPLHLLRVAFLLRALRRHP